MVIRLLILQVGRFFWGVEISDKRLKIFLLCFMLLEGMIVGDLEARQAYK